MIVTRGVRSEIEQLLEPYASELELHVLDAARTTTLQTWTDADGRAQQMLEWAGQIGDEIRLDTAIAHLAPVARETPTSWHGRPRFVGITPQGLVRDWSGHGGRVVARTLDPRMLPARCDAVVLSDGEVASCAPLLDAARSPAPIVAVTAAARPTELHLAGGERARVAVPRLEAMRDDIGAGDVFAAAFFVALADGATPAAAATFANAAAAVRIEGSGPAAIGDRAAIEGRAAAAE